MYKPDIGVTPEDRIHQFAPLVKRIAYHFMTKVPASVEVDDLIQTGLIGLMEAAHHFDPTQGAQFETYASQRIRGAMLDFLREADWMPRNTRRNLRLIEATIQKLEQRLGRPATEQEIAKEMNLSLADYQQMLDDARGYQLIYYDDYDEDGEHEQLDRFAADAQANPFHTLDDADFRKHLKLGIEALPEREKMVMALYYEQELNLKEIGEVLSVTESRVCQLHSQAIARLRAQLGDWVPANPGRKRKAKHGE
ncbi:RNA polymerase sigma factor for flagellar operon FliA [Chitinivorax tropicus]|uniref:RNA polymerase sigma factor FliA n=1 Tax=Chitinivorax tropicus TaxID=714531 RepID=A0A840MNS2_9PROT|nr:RNA polymerase sigma factor FliA [Chitinivorax tropicus]MBB5017823.1 RNA polymerase sigma factor for flagellar operon FliA [Chitinivorax tropicus]